MPTASSSPAGLPRLLNRDWAELARTHQHLNTLLHNTGFRGRRQAADRDAIDTVVDEQSANACLADLVQSAQQDPLAARVVLQRLLPGLIGIARRRHAGWEVFHACDELVANAWIVIRCYPIDRRPTHVAANLLRDIEYQTYTRPSRLRRHVTEPIEPGRPGHEPIDHRDELGERHGFVELVELLAQAREAKVDRDSLRLAVRIASGRTIAELAAEDGISERMERYRRAAAVGHLQQIALADEDSAPTANAP